MIFKGKKKATSLEGWWNGKMKEVIGTKLWVWGEEVAEGVNSIGWFKSMVNLSSVGLFMSGFNGPLNIYSAVWVIWKKKEVDSSNFNLPGGVEHLFEWTSVSKRFQSQQHTVLA